MDSEFTDDYQDGNVLAGPLQEIFSIDLTSAVGRCAHCGLAGAVATLRVYGRAPGLVARCPGCSEVMLRLVQSADSIWLDLTGTLRLQIPV